MQLNWRWNGTSRMPQPTVSTPRAIVEKENGNMKTNTNTHTNAT